MRRLLLIASTIGALTIGAGAAQAGTPVRYVDWHHHHCVDRCYYPPVRYVQPNVVYYPPVYAPPVYAAPPVVVAPPAGFVSLRGRNFGLQFGF
jgi:hypothetical protein